jgi:TRAP-type C4-dicarboxylate transport system permease small subunit
VAGFGHRPFLEKLDRIGRHVETIVLVALLGGMIFLACAQIFLRNVLETSWIWADSVLDQMVLWIAIFGALAASRDRKQINIDVITRLLPPRPQRVVRIVLHLFTAGVCLVVAWYGLELLSASREIGDEFLGLPAWYFQSVVPVGFALIAYRYLVLLLTEFAGLFGDSEAQ